MGDQLERTEIGLGDSEPLVIRATVAQVVRALSGTTEPYVRFQDASGSDVYVAVQHVRYIAEMARSDGLF